MILFIVKFEGKESDDGSSFESRKRKDHPPPTERGAASHGDSNVHFHRRPPLATQDRNISQNHERRATRDTTMECRGKGASFIPTTTTTTTTNTPARPARTSGRKTASGNESQNTISSTDTVDAGRTSVQQTCKMQPVTLTQLSQRSTRSRQDVRETKHGGTRHHVQPDNCEFATTRSKSTECCSWTDGDGASERPSATRGIGFDEDTKACMRLKSCEATWSPFIARCANNRRGISDCQIRND